ncbi:hypothetical protein [Botrimarina hoheduenensis]|uniref:NHL repeat protein n=1 Tax=Botrimarina hoheduenensis TaxID=2528000 RepID=A0A5C5WC66_9BACT|nr:hypothetical protein [Botrimarina hoheduenensis]TWT48508.1 NHL repeat protein [Botrimarina hoheduenensis]
MQNAPQISCWFLVVGLAAAVAVAHEGHDHEPTTSVQTAFSADPKPGAVTGSGDFVFRYNAELSALPAEIAAGIKDAHGGFAKGPDGAVYFGLVRTGVIRIAPDLKHKTLLSKTKAVVTGALHNTTYVADAEGDYLVLSDPELGDVDFIRTDGSDIGTLGKPASVDGAYRPTDADVASNGLLYVCDGYGSTKQILTADPKALAYGPLAFGGPAGKGRTPGKFSTNHGVTFDPTDDTLLIADRERQWVQRLSLSGEFIEAYDLEGGNPCDVDFVEVGGERLMIVGCLVGDNEPGLVQILRDGRVVATLRPAVDLGLDVFRHIHNAAGIVVEGKLYVLCYGWNPGCFAVLEAVSR